MIKDRKTGLWRPETDKEMWDRYAGKHSTPESPEEGARRRAENKQEREQADKDLKDSDLYWNDPDKWMKKHKDELDEYKNDPNSPHNDDTKSWPEYLKDKWDSLKHFFTGENEGENQPEGETKTAEAEQPEQPGEGGIPEGGETAGESETQTTGGEGGGGEGGGGAAGGEGGGGEGGGGDTEEA